MKSCLRIVLLVFLVTGTLTQEFDLSDAFDIDPTQEPKAPEPEKPKSPDVPKTDEFDLSDAFDKGPTQEPKAPEPEKPKSPDVPKTDDKSEKKPSSGGGGGGDGFDLEAALVPDNPTEKPAPRPPKGGGGGGSFDITDLEDVAGGDFKPDGGRSGGRGEDSGHDTQGGADQPEEAGSGQIAGIVSAIGVAILGAASSYFAYQKKKLCFKLQGGQDPESGKDQHGTQSDPQVLSNLLKTS
ncbi:CD99 molecule isoform X1 [Scomber scombrus]|uniref:CD99 molecule isoform X1 n=1 Tax=Scomber scombrus TaxID=13677 RepID=UPI002DD9B25E|nr:CD99 molecule isoform X1 [Scomber scombrus]